MISRSRLPMGGFNNQARWRILALASFAGGGVAVSQWDERALAGYLAMSLAAAAFGAITTLTGAGRAFAALGALASMAYPPVVLKLGEDGILLASAGALVMLSAVMLLRRPGKGYLHDLSIAMTAVIYLGSSGSYVVLLREGKFGKAMLLVLVLMVAAYHLASALAGRRPGTVGRGVSAGGKRRGTNWSQVVAGWVACELAAVSITVVASFTLGIRPQLIIGLVVAAAATVGRAAALMVARDLAPAGPAGPSGLAEILIAVNSALLAAPAFYYGLRLYLV